MVDTNRGNRLSGGKGSPPSDTIEWGESHSGAVKRSDAEKSLK